MNHNVQTLATISISLLFAFIFGMFFRKIKITPIIGYLIAGICIGPFTPGFSFINKDISHDLSELGIILLMFAVGLHFSIKDLLEVKKIAIIGAILQITASTIVGTILGIILKLNILASFTFGICFATASTVVALRTMESLNILETIRGKIVVGWLVVEDIILVLALVIIPTLITINNSNISGETIFTNPEIIKIVFKSLLGIILFIAVILLFGVKIKVIPWIVYKTAATGSDELFNLSIITIAISIAFFAAQIFNVSFALGAFIAGLILNESKLNKNIINNTQTLTDIFSVLFFVSVGMLFDPSALIDSPILILFTTIIVMVFNPFITYVILYYLFKKTKKIALTVAISFAQIGEFSFILSGIAVSSKLFTNEYSNLILAGAMISIVLNPLLFKIMNRYLNEKNENKSEATDVVGPIVNEDTTENIITQPIDIENHIIITDNNSIGSALVEKLQVTNDKKFVVISESKSKVESYLNHAIKSIWGNYKNIEDLLLAKINNANAIIFTDDNIYSVSEVISEIRKFNHQIIIITYADSRDKEKYLLENGVDFVINPLNQIVDKMLNITLTINKNSDQNITKNDLVKKLEETF